jgi:lauroyl/myristoyl acyltransferase
MLKYLLFQLGIQTLGRLPLRLGYALAEVIGRVAYFVSSGSRRSVIDNLTQVMGGNAGPAAVRAAARRVFVNVAKYYVDLVRMPRMDLQDFFDRRFHYEGFDEYLLPAVAQGKGVIVLSLHLGNPELAVQGMLPRGVSVFALTEPLEPERLHKLVDSLRASKGHTFAPVGYGGVKEAVRTLRRGGVVCLMGDRDIKGPKARLPFFGEETLVPTGPIEMALRSGATLIPSHSRRTGADRIEAYLDPPMELERTGDTERDVLTNTRAFLAWAETKIREHPDQWVVLESIWDHPQAAEERPAVAAAEKR